ncbi:alpha/beta hydrolase [Amycolatopsis nigrescens]|uniref:alpha/beta hydrolase n=1 Tax=Amycolatopsis nigrescens TaxID=381445 RepID=UPI0003634F09|nr:alpha/beta hydrolase [Amycolatopsis nigrescens]
MVGYGDVRKWRPEPLDTAEQQLKGLGEQLLGLADEFTAMGTPAGWSGGSAETAKGTRTRVTDRMEHVVAGVGAARSGLMQGADAVAGLKRGVEEADGLAKARGFTIGDDGSVTDTAPPQNVPPEQADDVARERTRTKDELVDRVEQILRRAQDIDNDLNGVFGRIMHGEISDDGATDLASAAKAGASHGGLSVLEPPSGIGTPGDNAGWWDTLSDAEKRQVIAQHPDWVGNRDGVPFTARDEANRARLQTEKARLQDEARKLQADLDDNVFGGLFSNADAGLDQVKAKLESIKAIEDTLSQPGTRQLLVLDMSNERAEAAVANGNVDKADHVAVFTPGLTSTVNGSLGDYDKNMYDLQQRTGDLQDRYGKGESVATVSWIGYQAPQMTPGGVLFDDNTVLDDHSAQEGAKKLAPFLNGIDTARDQDAHVTALGHSYGSTTTGLALQQNTGVDDAVFFGSPGLGTSDIGDLKVPEGHAHYIEGRNDPVGDFGYFGIDPSHMDGMQHLSAKESVLPGSDKPMTESAWHSYYLDDNSTSQYNMGVVVGGMRERAITDDGKGLGDILSWPVPGTY